LSAFTVDLLPVLDHQPVDTLAEPVAGLYSPPSGPAGPVGSRTVVYEPGGGTFGVRVPRAPRPGSRWPRRRDWITSAGCMWTPSPTTTTATSHGRQREGPEADQDREWVGGAARGGRIIDSAARTNPAPPAAWPSRVGCTWSL